MHKTYIDKLGLLLFKDKKSLVARSFGKDAWFTPGGKREAGETDEQAIVREIREELCVELDVQSLKYYGTFEAAAHGKPEGTVVKITCYTGSYTGELKPGSEIEELEYFGSNDSYKLSAAGKLIFEDLQNKGLIE